MSEFPKNGNILRGWGENATSSPRDGAPFGPVITTGKCRHYRAAGELWKQDWFLKPLLRLFPQGQSRCFQSTSETDLGKASAPHWRASSLFSVHLVSYRAPVGTVVVDTGALNVTLLFWHPACMLKESDSWIHNVLCQTLYCKSQNSCLDVWLSNHATSGLVMLMKTIWPCFLCEQSCLHWFI